MRDLIMRVGHARFSQNSMREGPGHRLALQQAGRHVRGDAAMMWRSGESGASHAEREYVYEEESATHCT